MPLVPLAWGLWAACVALSVTAVVFDLGHWNVPVVGASQSFGSALLSIVFASAGVVIAVKRPRNAVGWIFLAISTSQAVSAAAVVGDYELLVGHRSIPFQVLTWVETWSWVPGFILIPTLLLQLFPDGRPLSRRWRPLVPVTIAGIALVVAGIAWTPASEIGDLPPGYRTLVPTSPVLQIAAVVGGIVSLFVLVLSVASLVLRYRRSRNEEREQLKWFVYAAIVTVVCFTGLSIATSNQGALGILALAAIPLLPVATALAIFRYRLYDIDVAINKTVVYGLLAAFITAVYVAIVVGIGAALGHGSSKPNLALSILATAVVAVAFQPVRDRVQRFANRLVYGVRATPYEVLAGFVEQVGGTYAAEDVLPRMARALAEGTGAEAAAAWLRVGSELRPEASWPADRLRDFAPLAMAGQDLPEILGVSLALPVRHREETLAALTLTKPPGEPLSSTERKLAEDLAGQAGLVVRNVALTEDLMARVRDIESSRARIVSAEDEERSRIERRIREGARRELEGVTRALGEAAALLSSQPERALTELATVTERGTVALESLREVARGIYPPLLADKGLSAALEAQGRRGSVPATVETDGIGRYPQGVESAVYFCCVEAMENAATHARPSNIRISVREVHGGLAFEVADDGSGFDPGATRAGIGLTGMQDRVAALDGELRVNSRQSEGTSVLGWVPLAGADERERVGVLEPAR